MATRAPTGVPRPDTAVSFGAEVLRARAEPFGVLFSTRFCAMTCAATIYVKRLEQVATFYAGCFGLENVDEVPGDYRVLESDLWTLSIVQVPTEVAAAIVLSDPPARRKETPIKLSFRVPSLTVARATIIDLGGQADDEEWEFRGFQHCDFTDPEGNVGQLRMPLALST